MFPFISKAARSIRVPIDHGTINVQRVRIERRRVGKFMTRLATPLGIYFVISTYSWWMPDAVKETFQRNKKSIEAKAEELKKKEPSEKNVAQYSDEWKEQNARISQSNKPNNPLDEQSERNLRNGIVPEGRNAGFKYYWIPLPFLLSRKPGVPYAEADTEWKEYVKLYQETERQHELKKLVVHETLKSLQRNPDGRVQLRRLDSAITAGVLLDLFIPLSRPSTYEMQGLLLDPKGTRITGKPFSEQTGQRIDRVLNPTVLMTACWRAGYAFSAVLYRQTREIFKEGVSKAKGQEPTTGAHPSLDARVLSPSDMEAITGTKPGQESDPSTTKSDFDPDEKLSLYFNREAVAKVLPITAKEVAKVVFIREFVANQTDALQTFPTGACAFYGTVDFKGRRGLIRNFVWATYLPREDRLYTPIIISKFEFLPNPVEWPRKKFPGPDPTKSVGEVPGQTAGAQELEKSLVQDAKHLLESKQKFVELAHKAQRDFDAHRIRIAEKAKLYEEMSNKSAPQFVKDVLGAGKKGEERIRETPEDAAKEVDEPKEVEGSTKKE